MKTPLDKMGEPERAAVQAYFTHEYFDYFLDYIHHRRDAHQKKVNKNLTSDFDIYNREQSIGIVGELSTLDADFKLYLAKRFDQSK